MLHRCPKCGEEKPYTSFRKQFRKGPYEPWNLRICKACVHDEYVVRREDPRLRANLQASSNAWKKANPEHHAKLAREYRARNKEKTLAQNKLNYAIRKGRIERQPCEACGSVEKVHAHHKSYHPDDWYNVRWLCFICHKMEHTE